MQRRTSFLSKDGERTVRMGDEAEAESTYYMFNVKNNNCRYDPVLSQGFGCARYMMIRY